MRTVVQRPLRIRASGAKGEAMNAISPDHYRQHPSGVECKTIAGEFNFCIGSAIKYLWRAGLKRRPQETEKSAAIRDLHKAREFIKFEIERLGGKVK